MCIKNLTRFFSNFLTFGKLDLNVSNLKTDYLNITPVSLSTLFEKNFRKLQDEINEKKNKLSKKQTKK